MEYTRKQSNEENNMVKDPERKRKIRKKERNSGFTWDSRDTTYAPEVQGLGMSSSFKKSVEK